MHRLSRAIHRTIGKEVDNIIVAVDFIIVEPSIEVGFRACGVTISIDIDMIRSRLGIMVGCLALLVAYQCVLTRNLSLVVFGRQFDFCTRHRLPRRGTQGHQSHRVAWQKLMHGIHVAHIKQCALGPHIVLIGGKLHEVHTHRQALDDHGVFQYLICRLAHIAMSDALTCAVVDDKFLDLGIVGIVSHLILCQPVDVHT